jgi:DNA primase small subunit
MPHSEPESEVADDKMDIQLEVDMEGSPAGNSDTQSTAEDDVPMTDASQGQPDGKEQDKKDVKDVKLEDLFDDMDSDDEFPSSKEPANQTTQSSSPDVPSSPM